MKNYFELVLAPIPVEDFFKQYHEKDILYIKRNDENYYKDILTSLEISDYLDRQDVFYPSLRMVKNGKEIPSADYTLKGTPIGHHRKDGIINTEKAFALFNSGATFVIQAGQRYFNHLSHCCVQLSKKFKAPVQANLYITPDQSQGFNPHWDTHDVFVLQISGTKTWHLYGFEKELPVKGQSFVSKDYNKEPLHTIQLMPGDFLYVPRGYVHDAVADNGISSHITIGVLSFTWLRLFTDLFQQLEEQKELREAIPFWETDLSTLIEQKTALLQQKIAELNIAEGLDKLDKAYRNTQPQPLYHYFESVKNISNISAESRIALNENIIYTWVKKEEKAELNWLGKTIHIPETTVPAFEYILSHKTFTLQNLPGNLEEEQKKDFVSKLIKEGVLYIDE